MDRRGQATNAGSVAYAPGSAWSHPFRAVWRFGQRHPVFRFVLGVGVLMGAFYAIYLPEWKYDAAGWFLSWNLPLHAEVTGAVLRLLGTDAHVSGTFVEAPLFQMEVVRGCDALEPAALFLAAVLAFPVRIRTKVVGAVVGILCMEATNVVRLVTLFYVGAFWPNHFRMMHEDVWQASFIVLSVVYWAIWALWASRPPVRRTHVPD